MIGRVVWVSCDRKGCDNECSLTGREATVPNVRREARRQGWTLSRDYDVCPDPHEEGA